MVTQALSAGSPDYHVAWVAHPEHLSQPTNILAFIVPAILVIVFIRRPKPLKALSYVLFAVAFVVVWKWMEPRWNESVIANYRRTAIAAADSTTPVVEGRIVGFVAAPADGHHNEEFWVNGVHFSYSDYYIDGCYNRSHSHEGLFRDSLQVRLHYLPPGCIVKVELAEAPMVLPN